MINYVTFTTGKHNDILVMELTGAVDVASSRFLINCIEGHIEEGVHKIILDCSRLQSINSMGLAAMIRANSTVKEQGGAIELAAVPGRIAEVLQVTQLHTVFHMHANVDDAIIHLDRQ